MKIDFENGRTHSKNVFYQGETESGLKFTIDAHWNDWDGWSADIDNFTWEEEEGTEEEAQKVIDYFIDEMSER